MSVRFYERDYGRSDEKCFCSMDRNYDKIRELTYGEMCVEMRKDLEEMIENDFVDKETAFDLVGDTIAYNEYAEDYIRVMSGS